MRMLLITIPLPLRSGRQAKSAREHIREGGDMSCDRLRRTGHLFLYLNTSCCLPPLPFPSCVPDGAGRFEFNSSSCHAWLAHAAQRFGTMQNIDV